MMLMTFQEFAEFPNKIYLFYEQAFQTLFLKHDSLKDLYIRKSRTGMDIHEFKRVFSYFCIHTHLEKEIVFSEEKAIEILRSSLKRFGKEEIKPHDVLNDLMSNLCLLHRDGINITFSHLSFQEYFSALYIKESPYSNKIYGLIDKIVLINKSSICHILYEMNPDFIEEFWLKPKIELLLSEINKNCTDKEKEIKIISILNALLIVKQDKTETSIILMPENTIDSYNYISFNNDLWRMFYTHIQFSINDINNIFFNENDIKIDNLASIDEFIESGFSEKYKIKRLSFQEIKSKLDYIEYYKLINTLYNKVVTDKKDMLHRIKDYIDNRNRTRQENIDELLSI
ncbi:hypothetical protein F543_20690 [Bibersteinia trehalosi USDA-ARS-USMARC-189]|nr:hypothetical protein F543_20690 [Bibersteinia trehalosi USDA-ARS-USMARC-189]